MSLEITPRAQSAREIENVAGYWLAHRDSGNWTTRDEQEFEAWMSESMAHRVTYWRLQDTWESALRLKALSAGERSADAPPPGEWNLSAFFPHRTETAPLSAARPTSRRYLGAASSLLIAFIVCAAAYFIQNWGSGSDYETAVGVIAFVPIPDGSKVTLNTDSQVKVAFDEKVRQIELVHGEAFFEVAKDAARPFIVRVGNQRVVALGTSFSVRKNDRDEVRVVVTEGSVRIEPNILKNAEVPAPRLSAGSVARASSTGLQVQHKAQREAEEELSWRFGVLVFDDVTLGEATAEFNRYNERKILIEDPNAAALRIAGSFRTANVESFVEVLGKAYPVKIVAENDDFRVTAER